MVERKTGMKKQWTVARKAGGTYIMSQPYDNERVTDGISLRDVSDKRTAVKLAKEIGGTIESIYKRRQKTNAKKRKPAAKKVCRRCR